MTMSRRLSLVVFMAAITASGMALIPAESAGSNEMTGPTDETPLAKAMTAFKRHLRRVKMNAAKPDKRADNLKRLSEMESLIIQTKVLEPLMLAKVPADRRVAFLRGYRSMQIDLLRALLDLEKVLIDEKYAEAGTLVKKVRGFEKPAHDRYIKDEN